MKSSLQERFARLGPIRVVDRVASGSPAVLSLSRKAVDADVASVTATISLTRRGVPMLRAKRAIEEMLESGRVWIEVPMVESVEVLVRELADAGIAAAVLDDSTPVDVAALRAGLRLTQEQFALRFGLDLRSLQNWESGHRRPDRATSSYLRVIARLPQAIQAALYREP